MSSHLDALNTAQRRAATTLNGPLLIVAGAGAGKTKTLTHRMLEIIRTGVAPEKILAVTFTNKAAHEMGERVAALLEEQSPSLGPIPFTERPHVKTFHSLGVEIIREQAAHLGLKRHFTIYDKDDSKKAVRAALKHFGIDPRELDPKAVLSFISKNKGDGRVIGDLVDNASGHINEQVLKIWQRYETQLKAEGALDFDDLLLVTYRLLRDNHDIRASYQKRWTHIHIDEYQDTNRVQYQLSSLLVGPEKNICVVGDGDQTIYTWRGAKMRNILDFEKDYPEAAVVLLEENYRSTKNIIAAANDIISKNEIRKEKNLFTNNPDGEKISLYASYDEAGEADYIATTAASLIKGGVLPADIAVLFRANFQSRVLEEAFLDADVPYQLLGTKFFERAEVKDVLSYIRAALNPDGRTDLIRIINQPTRGIGKVTILAVVEGKQNSLPPATQEKVRRFFTILENIRKAAATKPPSELIKYVIVESGLEAVLDLKHEDDVARLENMRELVTLATRYDKTFSSEGDGPSAIEALLDDAALMSDQDNLENEGGVKLMTVHAAKGLEFDYVFIAGLEEDLFPHQRASEVGLSQEEREEERRLMYVAITRAKKKLFLTYAMSRTLFGSEQFNPPSQFIGDIDPEYLEEAVIAEPAEHTTYENETGVSRDEARRRGIESIFEIDF